MREKVPRGPSAGEQPAGGRVEGGGRDLWVLLGVGGRGGERGRRRVHGRDGGGDGDRLAAAHLHSLGERADSQGRTYRLRPSSPSAIGHKSAQCIPRVSLSPTTERAATEKVMRPIPP